MMLKNPKTVKERIFKVLLTVALILILGIAYGIFCSATGLAVPCIFHKITGLKCPSCGVTTMCICLMHLDFSGAFEANPVLLLMLPYLAYIAVIYCVRYIKYGKVRLKKYETATVTCACAVLVIFGIIRNIIGI